METTIIAPITGIHCASCASVITKSLQKISGVSNCQVNVASEKATITYDQQITNPAIFAKVLFPLGYTLEIDKASLTDKQKKLEALNRQRRQVLLVFPVSALIFFSMLWSISSELFTFLPSFPFSMALFNQITFLLSSLILFGFGQVYLKAIKRFAINHTANMDTLVGIGTLVAYTYSSVIFLFPTILSGFSLPETTYFDVTIVVIGFVMLGKYLEASSKIRTGETIEKGKELQAKSALVERGGQEFEVDIASVQVGDIVIVKPGAKVAVDGVIIEGQTSIDESLISGEPLPVDKGIGDIVIGSTINKQGAIKFRATKVGADTFLSQIITMVETAQGSKATIERLADKISAVFVPIVLLISLLTLVIWVLVGSQFVGLTTAIVFGLTSFVGVLVIACPCALGLATPTGIIVGVGKGAENGILIKNAESLEKLHSVTTVVMDKTGTITQGQPAITDIVRTHNLSEDEILILLSSLEKLSEHPLAVAVVEQAVQKKLSLNKVTNFKIIEGKGLQGKIGGKKYYAGNATLMTELEVDYDKRLLEKFTIEGKTPILLSDGKVLLGLVIISDPIKDSAINSIDELHHLGLKVIMLTGDDLNTAKYIGNQVGVDSVIAQVLPGDKAEHIKSLQRDHQIVAMVGDGVNDAPALVSADVGIAMGTGTDIAIDSANITLLHGDLKKVVQAIKLSKNTFKTIKQNLFWAFIYNVIGIPIAAGALYPLFGVLLNPAIAGAAMAFSSVSVVANSLRLKRLHL